MFYHLWGFRHSNAQCLLVAEIEIVGEIKYVGAFR